MSTAYQQLENHYGQIGMLVGANALLFWDRNVVMRPGSAPAHAAISGAMTAIVTEKQLDPRLGDWLSAAEEKRGELSPWQAANLVEMRRRHQHATAVPAELQVRMAKTSAEQNPAWQKARAENNFKLFEPGLTDLVAMAREIAAYKAAALKVPAYDALMDEHDPGMTIAIVDRVFSQLAQALPGLLNEVLDQQASWKPLPLTGPFAAGKQQELCEALMRAIGYDFNAGRLDVTTHPFAVAQVPGDTRITTRFKEDDLRFALMATIHETGHSLYEANLPREWSFQPVGVARGATLHESQSLMLEMQACRSTEFVRYVAPLIAARFGAGNPAYAFDNLRQHYHRIQRNYIRIEADEIVYPLHVILRYEIERQLLDGKLAVKNLPEAWNTRMRELIGIVPPTDTLGCLQDVHWSFGMFGYFPNYALGATAAAQLFAAANKSNPRILPSIEKGDFAPYYAWVKPNVHQKASSESMDQILRSATGKPLEAESLISHLRRRYLGA